MTKITPDHLARSAFVYIRQSTADSCSTTMRAVVVNMPWPIAPTNMAGRTWS